MPSATLPCNSSGSPATLLIGASGFLGREVLRALVRQHDVPVIAMARRPCFAPDALRPSDEWITGDITLPDFGLPQPEIERLLSRVNCIVNCAGIVSFFGSSSTLTPANVEGIRNLMSFARTIRDRGKRLRRVLHVSTAYVEGLLGMGKEPARAPRNAYESSKAAGELALQELSRDIPLIIARPSIIVGRSSDGYASAFHGVYPLIRSVARGGITLPCAPDCPLDVVPVDWVADAIVQLIERREVPPDPVVLSVGIKGAATPLLLWESFLRVCPDLAKPGSRAPFDPHIDPSMVHPGIRVFLPYLSPEGALRGLPSSIVSPAPSFASYGDRVIRYPFSVRWDEAAPDPLRAARCRDRVCA